MPVSNVAEEFAALVRHGQFSGECTCFWFLSPTSSSTELSHRPLVDRFILHNHRNSSTKLSITHCSRLDTQRVLCHN